MNGALAAAAYDLATLARFARAYLPLPGLTWAARHADQAGNALDLAQTRVNKTRRHR